MRYRGVAQLVARLLWEQDVAGSNPVTSTTRLNLDCSLQKTEYAFVAQSVEQGTENPRVGGSIPPGGTIFCGSGSVVERHLAKVNVASSNLVFRSN